jgi:hypothetical protein
MESNIASDYMQGGSNGADVAGSLRSTGLQYHMPVGAGTLKIALLKPVVFHANDAAELTLVNSAAGYVQDDDSTLPRFEVSYSTKISRVEFGLLGGYNSSTIEMHGSLATDPTYSYDVDSYIYGGWFNLDFKPAYIKGSITAGQNWANYGVVNTFNDSTSATAYNPTAITAAIADASNLSYGLVVGFVANDKVTVEGWYYHSESDISYTNTVAAYDIENEGDTYGAMLTWKVAENVYIIPEIAFYDAGQTTTYTNGVANVIPVENGTQTQYGICWKINF